jgi:MscS family membrane protein
LTLSGWLETLGTVAPASWVWDVTVVLVAAAVVDFSLRRLLTRVHARLERTTNPWDDALLVALRNPLGLFVWVIALSVSMQIADQGLQQGVAVYLPRLREVGVIACVGWFLLRWIRELAGALADQREAGRTELDLTTIMALRKLGTTVVVLLVAVVTLETLGFDLPAVVTVGGVGGVAAGFASRDVVANFFGGLMIYVTHPFGVGDWIRSPDRDIEGTVEDIGWYQTRIRTFSSRPLYVPNSIFAGIALENPSRMTHRRIYETIGVRYDDFAQVARIVDDCRKMLAEHPEIESGEKLLMVNFDAFSESSLDFFVYTFTKTTDWATYHRVKQDVLLRIGEIVESHGAEIAFPTRTLHVPELGSRATAEKA